MARGDHIKVDRGLYWHHGIEVGRGMVIHFDGEFPDKSTAVVSTTTIVEFADGRSICTVDYLDCYTVDTTVRKAKTFLGERGYSLLFNNCEHFATWCKTGDRRSTQVVVAADSVGLMFGLSGTHLVEGLKSYDVFK